MRMHAIPFIYCNTSKKHPYPSQRTTNNHSGHIGLIIGFIVLFGYQIIIYFGTINFVVFGRKKIFAKTQIAKKKQKK